MTAPVYEMLWDCAYCGTRGLLGKTHRFCPKCGAPQDPSRRYFPPPGEEVAVQDHVYVGADLTCGACDSAMSAAAAHCTQCGSDMTASQPVALVQDGAPAVARPKPPAAALAGMAAPPPAGSPPARRPGSRVLSRVALGCGGLLALGLVFLLLAIFWRKQDSATAVSHAWERTISIEALAARQDSAWCDQLPSGAYGVSRRNEVRSHRRIADGEDCTDRRVDQGDGTFRVERDCTTRYREEPVHDDRCYFTIDRWETVRSAKASGDDAAARWPEARLLRAGSCRGCEREGKRTEGYRVRFRTSDGKTFDCPFPEERWRGIADGSRWTVSRSAVTGTPFCDTLKPGS